MKNNINPFSGWQVALTFACMAFLGTANSFGVIVTNTLVFNTANTTNYWQCPPGVTSIQVECWGGGGAGGSARTTGNSATGIANCGGGGGGAYAKLNSLVVTPGTNYAVIIPPVAVAPSSGFFNGTGSTSGGNVTFTNEFGTGITASGGGGGVCAAQSSTSQDVQNGGTGGPVTAGADASFAGGNGARGGTAVGGGSGAGASDLHAGTSASGSITTANGSGAAATIGSNPAHYGGAGTNGVADTSVGGYPGLPGNTPGGGGSGGAVKGAANTTFTAVGGNGGAGQIILTYSFTPSTFVKADNQANLNNGNSYVGSVAPDPYTTVTFNNTLQTYGTFSLGGNFAWGGIVVSNPASAIIIANDGNTLTNGATGIDMSQATVNMTLSNQMVLAANQTWNVTNTKTLLVAGQVTGNNTITATGGGTIQLGAANVLPGGASLALNAGTLDLNTFSQTINNLNGSSVIDTVAGGTPSLTVTNGTFSGNLQNTAGSLSLIMAGAGNTLFLSGSNSFIGTTTILAGTLQLGNVNALQNCSGVSMAGGTVLQSTLDGVTIAAPITAGFAGTTVTINAPTNNPGNQGFDMLILDGAIGGAGNLIFSSVLNVNTINTVLLGAQSTYGGNTLLTTTGGTASQAFIRLGTNNALPATTVLTLDGGTGAGSGRFVDLNLNGFNQTLAGLTNTARALRVQRVVNSDVSAYATLTISNNSDVNFGYNSGANSGGYLGSSAANGSVNPTAMPGATGGNNFGLTKSGSGTFTLVSPSTYTGNTVINAGSLALGGSGAISGTPNIIVGNGATFDVSGLASAFTLGGSQTLSNNAASTGNLKGSLATATGAVSVNFSSGTPAFAVTAGTLTLSNTTTFKVNNTGSALAGGSYTIITNNGGSVAVVGALPAVTVIGGGIVSGATVALATNSMGLQLVVTSSQGPNYLQIKSPQIINGQQVMTFYGTAGNGYALDWTTNLNAPVVWSAIITNIASGDGSTLFTNSMAQPIAFYRVRQVSP